MTAGGGPPLVAVEGLGVQYGTSSVALSAVDVAVHDGEAVAILGSNGAGKTTLLRAISGVLAPAGGRQVTGGVSFRGTRIDSRSAGRRVRLGLVQVPEGRQIFATLTVEENLRLGRYARRRGRGDLRTDLDRVYRTFPILGSRRAQPAGLLSGGEQQMLALGRALIADPAVLILDEPSLGLAPRIVEQVSGLIKEIHGRGTAVLIVEQNAHVALDIADRAYVLNAGRVVLSDTAEALTASPHIRNVYLGGEVDAVAG
jgi:branched-chain amino acid transport system ATP-binding protein